MKQFIKQINDNAEICVIEGLKCKTQEGKVAYFHRADELFYLVKVFQEIFGVKS